LQDVIVGAYGETVGSNSDQGRIYVFNGLTGARKYTLNSPTLQGTAYFGWSVISGGANGDGCDDIIVGVSGEDVGSNTDQGRVYSFNGATAALLHTLTNQNPQANANFGCSVGSGRIIIEDKIGLFRQSTRTWYFNYDNTGNSEYSFVWGGSTDVPLSGIWS